MKKIFYVIVILSAFLFGMQVNVQANELNSSFNQEKADEYWYSLSVEERLAINYVPQQERIRRNIPVIPKDVENLEQNKNANLIEKRLIKLQEQQKWLQEDMNMHMILDYGVL